MGMFDWMKDVLKVAQAANRMDLYEKVMDLMGQVSDLTDQRAKLKEDNAALKEEIAGLKALLNQKAEYVFDQNVMWRKNPDGSRDGPFCPRCMDVSQQPVRMLRNEAMKHSYCPECKTKDQVPTLATGVAFGSFNRG